MPDGMFAIVEVLEVRSPKSRAEDGCSVYGCPRGASTVLLVGGGAPRATGSVQLRFCATHTFQLRDRLAEHAGRI